MNIEHISFRRYDIIIGGSFVHILDEIYYTASIPYDYDDIIWCTQRSKIIPKYLSILKMLPPEMWYVVGFVGVLSVGIVTYFIVQFDSGINRRNQMDMNYMIVIHTFSFHSFVSNVHNFKPKKTTSRIMFGIRLLMPIIFQGVIGVNLYRCMKYDIFYNQMSTLCGIVDNNFRIAGSPEVFHMIHITIVSLFAIKYSKEYFHLKNKTFFSV